MATPEACFALACLRRLADPKDTLAATEIIALSGSLNPEEWLAKRLEYLASLNQKNGAAHDLWGVEPPLQHPIVTALEAARPRLSVLTPGEALDLALSIADAPAIVSAWGSTDGQASQRRANLEALRIAVRNYEQFCADTSSPATIAGFFWWSQENAAADAKALDPEAAAITVATFHGAKGLEWPVVICTGFATEPRPRIWGSVVEPINPEQPFNLEKPLVNRTIRFWPWPFGQSSSGIALDARVANSAFGQRAEQQASKEEMRLLYVGLTRARDRLVLAWDLAQPQSWLDGLKAPWLKPTDNGLILPDRQCLPIDWVLALPPNVAPAAEPIKQYVWFPPAKTVTTKLPAQIIPSHQVAVSNVQIGQMLDLRGRLPLKKNCDEATLGDALHTLLAAEMIQLNRPGRDDFVARVLKGFDLHAVIDVSDVLAMVDRFQKFVNEKFKPKSVLVEVPFEYSNEAGQRVAGFMDLLLETESGWILVDHKSFPGKKDEWGPQAASYSGQLQCYRNALAKNGYTCSTCWIHFMVGGGLLELL